jgi:hypothetical protein
MVEAALLLGVLAICVSCEKPAPKPKLIYFGFTDHTETPDDAIRMAKEWGNAVPCSNWQPTVKKEEADFQLLFTVAGVTVTDRRGRVLYTGGPGPLYLPHGNPDGTGVNLCKLMDDDSAR